MAMTAKERRERRDEAKAHEAEAAQAEAAATGKAPRTEEQIAQTVEANRRAFENSGGIVPDAHGAVAPKAKSGATVTVACKLGVAWYDIQLCKIEDKFEQNMQGGRQIKEAIRIGNVVRLRGTAYPRGTPPEGFPPAPLIIGGAAMNPGVPKDFWDAWKEQHALDPLVVNGFIFAHESQDHVAGFARETASKLSGLEPVNPKDPKGDPRMPKPTRAEISPVEAGTTK